MISDGTGNGSVKTMLRNYVGDGHSLNWSIPLCVQLSRIQYSIKLSVTSIFTSATGFNARRPLLATHMYLICGAQLQNCILRIIFIR
jgi:hypothetical protein